MGLADSRLGRQAVMDSRRALGWDPPSRASQVPDWSVDARRPQSPRRAQLLPVFDTSQLVAGFAFFGRLATLNHV